MKIYSRIIFFLSFAFQNVFLIAQVGINTTAPSAASVLHVESTTNSIDYGGFIPPRVDSNTQRDLIAPITTDMGLLVFVKDTGCLNIWSGTVWENVYCLGNNTSITGNVWINEFHYDNVGNPDTDESVEIAGTAGVDLTGYTLFFTNGATTGIYNSISLSGVIPDDGSGFGALAFTPVFNIQNGTGTEGDGIALVGPNNDVLQNLSYENTFTITEPGNVLDGLIPTLIGVSEVNTTPVGQSLQLTGTGGTLADFTWSGPIIQTRGTVNTGQTFN